MAVAYSSQNHSIPGWEGPPALLIGDEEYRLGTVARMMEDAGLRVAAQGPAAAAIDRLDLQAMPSWCGPN